MAISPASPPASSPCEQLAGLDLGNGWKVVSKITRTAVSTGGSFSVGYSVEDRTGKKAFLKALDFSAAAQTPDSARALQGMLEAYNYERDLLNKCRDKKMSRVMTPILDGKIDVSGWGIFSPVYYLIFEMAEGDIRNVLAKFNALDLLWRLRFLHHVAVGINQLHVNGIAHQDVKPSNVLVFKKDGSKLGDLGRASDQSKASPHDSFLVPGAKSYAPLDLYYHDSGVTGFEKRRLIDLYLLGSLFFFVFAGVSASHALHSKLKVAQLLNQSFKQDLPFIQHAFAEAMAELRPEVKTVAGKLSDEIIVMIEQLCDPDPTKRGDPGWKGSVVPRYDLSRYISKLDLFCKKIEAGLV